jgi:hypothetical protein
MRILVIGGTGLIGSMKRILCSLPRVSALSSKG